MNPFPVVLLHHSGGSAQVFGPLLRALPEQIHALVPELPGRGRRWREKPALSAREAVGDLAEQVTRAGITGEFAIFGHSMGAYLGLLLAAHFEGIPGGAYCGTLFASANAGPRAASPLFGGDPREADDDVVLDTAARFGGLPPQVLAHEHLRERTAELLRADFSVCDSFVRTHSDTVTGSRIVVCHGTDDILTAEQLDRWRLSTTAGSEVVPFAGDHFYITDCAAEVAEKIAAHLGIGPPGPDRHQPSATV